MVTTHCMISLPKMRKIPSKTTTTKTLPSEEMRNKHKETNKQCIKNKHLLDHNYSTVT